MDVSVCYLNLQSVNKDEARRLGFPDNQHSREASAKIFGTNPDPAPLTPS